MGWAAAILALGEDASMKSETPKVLHRIAGREIVSYVLDALAPLDIERRMLVVGRKAEMFRETLGDIGAHVAQIEEPSPARALSETLSLLKGKADNLLVLPGDAPFLSVETLKELMKRHSSTQAAVTVLPPGDVYCLSSQWLESQLSALLAKNSESFIAGLLEVAEGSGGRVEWVALKDPAEGLRIENRLDLARAEALLWERIRERLMLGGVTLVAPASIYIDATVEIGEDTVIYPNTTISGETRVGRDCHLGPNSVIADSTLGDGCRVRASVVEGAVLGKEVEIGPFSHIRPESRLDAGVHIGNYAEVKKSHLGRGTRVGHFSYIGDAKVGQNVNIGAGAITCNFDGVRKHRTVIGDNSFIGSDCLLIAPVQVGAGAVTGAGSVVNHDVPPNTLAVGAPARFKGKKQSSPSRSDGG